MHVFQSEWAYIAALQHETHLLELMLIISSQAAELSGHRRLYRRQFGR